MASSLGGKTALITGSGSGMGRSHAVLLAERGARVVTPGGATEVATIGESERGGTHTGETLRCATKTSPQSAQLTVKTVVALPGGRVEQTHTFGFAALEHAR